MRRFRIQLILFLSLFVTIGWGLNHYVPSQHLPWRSLDVNVPLGRATDVQLFRLSLSSSANCAKQAEKAFGFHSSPAEPKVTENKCGWEIARDVSGSLSGELSSSVPMQCPLAVGTYIWIEEIDKLAQKHFGSALKTIHHYGTYSCRRQRGNGSGEWSEHAYANAWDIGAFELENGQHISVLEHWFDGTKAQKRFLRGVRSKACQIFRVTLSPDYNFSHRDHLHVDMGPAKSCR